MFLLCESITEKFGMQLYNNFSLFLLKIGLKGCPLWKHSSSIRRNCLPRFAFTLTSNVLFLDLRFLCSLLGWNFSLYVWPLFSNAAWYVGAALLNAVSYDEMSDRRLLMLSGIRFTMLGGWLLFTWTYWVHCPLSSTCSACHFADQV